MARTAADAEDEQPTVALTNVAQPAAIASS